MKTAIGFLAGVASTAAIGVAAQCLDEGALTPMVQIFDMRTKQKIIDCKVTITMLNGHRVMCQRNSE